MYVRCTGHGKADLRRFGIVVYIYMLTQGCVFM